MKLDFLPIGKVTGTHGIKGELRVKPLCDSPAFFRGFAVLFLDEHGKQSVAIKAARPHKNMALLTIDGVLNIEDAQAWIGRTLYLKRDDARLDDGQYFVAELIGCQILDAENSGVCYGILSDVSQTGANDVWHICRPNNTEALIPVIDDVVKTVDIEAGIITITPISGLFDDV